MLDDGILRSWKEIAEHLKCDKKTCARWEEECGLPVRRVDPRSKRSRVFAFKSELSQWLAQKTNNHNHFAVERPKRRVPLLLVSAAVLGLMVPMVWLISKKTVPAETPVPVIMVFPIRYADASAADRYLAEGLTKEIIQRLVVSTKAKVMSVPLPLGIETAASAQPATPGLRTADYTLEGEVRKNQENLSLSFNLNDWRNKRLLWRKDFEASTGGLSPCLDEICGEIRKRLMPSDLSPLRSGFTLDKNAFDTYLKGNYLLGRIGAESKDPWTLYHQGAYYSRLGDQEANDLAIQLFSQALKLDPGFGAACLGLAACYANYVNFNWRFEKQWLDKADELVEQAQKLTPNLPLYFALRIELLLIREAVFGEDNNRAYFDLAEKGLSLYPYDGRLNSIIGYCFFQRFDREGRESDLAEALKYKERAYFADQFTIGNIVYAEFLMLKQEYDRALQICAAVEAIRTSPLVDFRRAEIYYYRGDLEKSVEIVSKYTSPVEYKLGALYLLGMIAARRNERSAALKIIEEIEMIRPNEENLYMNRLHIASIYAGLKETGKAESLLRTIFSDGNTLTSQNVQRKYMEIDPNFSNFRSYFIPPKATHRIP